MLLPPTMRPEMVQMAAGSGIGGGNGNLSGGNGNGGPGAGGSGAGGSGNSKIIYSVMIGELSLSV